jgi:hypothetical protein
VVVYTPYENSTTMAVMSTSIMRVRTRAKPFSEERCAPSPSPSPVEGEDIKRDPLEKIKSCPSPGGRG